MDASQNIELFQELIRCGGEISLWQYDGEGNLLSSNCPEEAIFDTAFSLCCWGRRWACCGARPSKSGRES